MIKNVEPFGVVAGVTVFSSSSAPAAVTVGCACKVSAPYAAVAEYTFTVVLFLNRRWLIPSRFSVPTEYVVVVPIFLGINMLSTDSKALVPLMSPVAP